MDIDDESVASMDLNTRRLAELKMNRRDRVEGVGKGGRRSRAPAFLQSDDEDDDREAGIIGRRRRRHYDENIDDEDGGADVSTSDS